MKRLILSILLCMLCIKISLGTCIAILVTDNSIIVAADSKRRVYLVNHVTGTSQLHIDHNFCKIHNYRNYYYAVSGFDDSVVEQISLFACERSRFFKDIQSNFIEDYKTYFNQAFEDLRKRTPKFYKERFGGTVSGVSFFWFEDAQPKIVTIYMNVGNDINKKSEISDSISYQRLIILGVYDHINAITNDEGKKLQAKGYIGMAKGLVEIEAKNHSDIGGDITLLELTANGANWIKKTCTH